MPLQVTGSIHGYSLKIWAFRRGERMPYRPTITGQLVPASEGSVFTGAVTFPRMGREVLIIWSCIVALAVVAGLVGLIGEAANGHPHAALHWLPLVIVPVAMALFAIGVYAASKPAARTRAGICGNG